MNNSSASRTEFVANDQPLTRALSVLSPFAQEGI